MNEDEEYVSYDVESLFTNVPVKKTINYILDEIYVRKKLDNICSRIIFKRLLEKLTMESTFIFQSTFYKQKEGCTMGGPLSVTFSNICLTKMENEIVRPLSPPFYHRYVDDIINCRKVVGQDTLFHNLNK